VAPPPDEALPQASQLDDYLNTAPRRMIPVDAPGAAVVVVKFNDYQCPPCGNTFQAYKPLKAKWDKEAPGKVKFVTKDFPLEAECNASIPQGPHPFACEAAAAVRMARKAGKAEALEDWLFANQPTLTLEGLKKAVREIGGVADFDAQYPKVIADVKTDTSLGGFLGVHSTPTFFVNGIQMPDNRVPIMDLAIEHELRKAGVLK
jgi:protein-disulfide isomerase